MDTNARVGALLRDLAEVQISPHSKQGYKRAAAAILALDGPLEHLIQPDGTLTKIQHVGPSSTKIVFEVLRTGESATVEEAVAASGRAKEIARRRSLRDNFLSRAEVVAALRNSRLKGPRIEDYRGDLQMHSTWSDGADSVAAMAATCRERGYHYCALTDHSYGLPIARGMSMEAVARQHREIDKLNRQFRGGFRIIKAIETNIRVDGTIDMLPEELRRLELVVASPHSKLRTADDQTARMLGAVRTPGVHILGHPRGRMYSSRPGVTADWKKVFTAAARAGVAIEIDGDPWRQDIDFALARAALSTRCLFALDSDAHSTGELRFAETAIAHARLAGIAADRIINYWSLDKLLEWTAKRQT